MLISCVYCGQIHDRKHKCEKRPKAKTKNKTKIDIFRSSGKWQSARAVAIQRDFYVCRVCLDMHGVYETNDLSVHHIVPLCEDFNLRCDINNLITLCDIHHKQADINILSREYLRELTRDPTGQWQETPHHL